ncbi:unnamed protein product [Macrosiphum euphorbiae]|uniref:Protein kinase domain-containing protein n=1 Tax=Macrosiphum euphorbiae TaxID=13131 RepID=A0AAV0VLF8_9HEMI|nr:unnamed protein product [Macrosiphum euphorbiae]
MTVLQIEIYAVRSLKHCVFVFLLKGGKFGTVFKCREKATSLMLAAKFVGILHKQDRRNVEREVEIMCELQHPRLIQLYDAFEANNSMCFILEL